VVLGDTGTAGTSHCATSFCSRTSRRMSRSTAQIMMVKTKGACHPSPEYRAPPIGGAYGIVHQFGRSHRQQRPESSIISLSGDVQAGGRFRSTHNGRTDGDARGGEADLPPDILLGYVLAYQREPDCTTAVSIRSLLATPTRREMM
jgi:hypothetical protein